VAYVTRTLSTIGPARFWGGAAFQESPSVKLNLLIKTEGYDEMPLYTRNLYGVEYIVEPHKTVNLEVDETDDDSADGPYTYDWTVRLVDSETREDDSTEESLLELVMDSAQQQVTFLNPGRIYRISVTRFDSNGDYVSTYTTTDAHCTY
jgi:hypothetical protein